MSAGRIIFALVMVALILGGGIAAIHTTVDEMADPSNETEDFQEIFGNMFELGWPILLVLSAAVALAAVRVFGGG